MFGILLTLVAVIAFILTGKLEDKINGRETTISKERKLVYASITVIPVVLIMLIWITPSRKEMLWNEAETAAQSADVPPPAELSSRGKYGQDVPRDTILGPGSPW